MKEVPIGDRWNPLGFVCRLIGHRRVLQIPFYLIRVIEIVRIVNSADERLNYPSVDLLHLLRRPRWVCQFLPVKRCSTASQTRQFPGIWHLILNAEACSVDARFHRLRCKFPQVGDGQPIRQQFYQFVILKFSKSFRISIFPITTLACDAIWGISNILEGFFHEHSSLTKASSSAAESVSLRLVPR